ncbi:MAG: hypothetical protein ACXABY_05140, partial [Candidatus Thorarchaeota archaeon]
ECQPIGVEFDEPPSSNEGHNLEGCISSRRGWYCEPNQLDIVAGVSDEVDEEEAQHQGFRIGDRVRLLADSGSFLLWDEGTVRNFYRGGVSGASIGVEFDIPREGHALDGHCPNGYGRYCYPDSLERLETPPDLHESLESFNMGDRVELVDQHFTHGEPDCPFPLGSLGTIRATDSERNPIVVNFDEGGYGHTCGGRCEVGHGYTLQIHMLRLLEPPVRQSSESAEPIDDFQVALSTMESVALINGQVFNLQPVHNPSAQQMLERRDERVAAKFRELRRDFQRQKEELEAKYAHTPVTIDITLEAIKEGVRVRKQGDSIFYLAPFMYAPKFLQHDGVDYNLKEGAVTPHDVLIQVKTGREGVVAGLSLRHPRSLEAFIHYHSYHTDRDCTGAVRTAYIRSLSDLYKIRDEYQLTLETINMDSLGNKPNRAGMPAARTLRDEFLDGERREGNRGWNSEAPRRRRRS